MQLHPIMYVADQYAERSFYELFGSGACTRVTNFPASWLFSTVKRLLVFSAHRPSNRPTRTVSAGSLS